MEQGGLDLGLSSEAIREILVQAALYTGFSAAEETLALAADVFAERGLPWAHCTATGPVSA
jgi:alkylhydroperoxidase/carboxymuconolactone decarboxylase family protein YurZ